MDRKARPPAWELQATPGQGGTRRRSTLLRGTPDPGLQRRLQRPIGQNSKGNKSSEYLVYPRVLRPATKLICMYQMDRGRLYSGLQDRYTRIRGNMLGLSKTSIFRRCLAAWGKNQPTVYININEITLKQKLLQQCIIVSCNNHQCFRVPSLDIPARKKNSEPTV